MLFGDLREEVGASERDCDDQRESRVSLKARRDQGRGPAEAFEHPADEDPDRQMDQIKRIGEGGAARRDLLEDAGVGKFCGKRPRLRDRARRRDRPRGRARGSRATKRTRLRKARGRRARRGSEARAATRQAKRRPLKAKCRTTRAIAQRRGRNQGSRKDKGRRSLCRSGRSGKSQMAKRTGAIR